MEQIAADAGMCPGCDKIVKGKRGWKKSKVMHEHLFNECVDYPYSKMYKGEIWNMTMED